MTTVNNHKVSPPSGKDEDQRETGFFNRPRKGGKSFWDWLNLIGLLLIPLVVGAATFGLGLLQLHLADLQHQNDIQLANDQQQEATLKAYLDDMTTLLLDKKLGSQAVADKVVSADAAVVARAKTLTALRRLTDPRRKAIVVQFLYEAHLIGSPSARIAPAIIDLNGADLNGAALSSAILPGAELSDAKLSGADLSGAFLIDVHLDGAELSDAKLSGADLIGAFLIDADLNGADLGGADLGGADLEGVLNLTQQQLDQVKTCIHATLPPGLTCYQNQTPP